MTDDNTDTSEVPEVTSLLVRSTVHLPDIGMDALIYVDPRVPYVAGCLDRGYLVPVEIPTIAVASPITEEPSRPELETPSPEQQHEERSSDEVDPGLEDAAAVEPD